MKAYEVSYNGSYLGGHAVVLANSAEEAIQLVKAHPSTCNFNYPKEAHKPEAREITCVLDRPVVLLNWDGDY